VEAFILLRVDVGTDAEVARRVADLPGVLSVSVVTGPHDVVVRAEADSIEELGKRVLRPMAEIPGIARTLTCPVMRRWTWLAEQDAAGVEPDPGPPAG
jgi:DNA-binding Lrp family transcriptional regulator